MIADPGKKTLIIVESPTKAKTISRFLPPTCRVIASMGHIADLAPEPKTGRYGVDVDNDYNLEYVIDAKKKDLIKEMKSLLRDSEQLALGETGGRSTTIIHPDPFFTDLLEDFAGFLPEDEGPAMESIVSGYAADLIASGAASDASWEKNGESYAISFTYDSIMEFLMAYGAGNQSLLRAGSTSLTFHLGIENYSELRDMVPFLSDPNFEVYGPEYCNGMTEDEYLEMIGFVLGEDGPEAIRSGRIMIRIHVPGTITEVSGGIAEDSSTALLTFPVIDFLLLNTPVDFSVSWR